MPSPFLFHPLAVHLALSLGLFSAAAEGLPPIKKRLSPRFRRRSLGVTLLFLALALITGALSLSAIQGRHIPLPLMAPIHGWIALIGTILFLLLWLPAKGGGERQPGTLPPRQIIAGAGLLALLVAATLGGHLVYDVRLGTSFMSGETLPLP